jgi:hypothetical protein
VLWVKKNEDLKQIFFFVYLAWNLKIKIKNGLKPYLMLKLNKQRLNLERWLNHKHHIHGTYDLKKKKRKPKT